MSGEISRAKSEGIVLRGASAADVQEIASVHLRSWLAAYRGILDDAYLESLKVETFAQYGARWFDTKTGKPIDGLVYLVACDATGAIVGFARGGVNRSTTPTGDPLPQGFAAAWSCELQAIYLEPAYFGSGLGTRLFRGVMSGLQAMGHASACVWVLRDNAIGKRFYERLGGVPSGECPVTLGGKQYSHEAFGWRRIEVITKID